MTGPRARSGHDDVADEELVAASRDGDRRALEVLLRRHHDHVHLICRRMCVDRGDAEDATQEALVAIVRGLPGYDGRARFTTWAYRVATNACLDQLRRRSRRPVPADPFDEPTASGGAGSAATGAPTSVGVDPAEHLVGSEQRSVLAAALASLPESFRLPVVLRDVADLDYAEIASVLDLPPGTVRSRIARGRARLGALLAELDPTAATGNQRTGRDVRQDERP